MYINHHNNSMFLSFVQKKAYNLFFKKKIEKKEIKRKDTTPLPKKNKLTIFFHK